MSGEVPHITSILTPLHDDVDLDSLDHSIRARSGGMLLLDYDGTLAPFVEKRHEAFPYPGIREILRALLARERMRVVIVSGRAVADLRPLLGLDPLPEIWGSHGWERLHPNGRYEAPDFSPQQNQVLEVEWQWLQEYFDAKRIEHKPASIAVHWRGLDEEARRDIARVVRERWQPHDADTSFELHAFDGGLELRVTGRNKGDAVKALLNERNPGDVVAYCGDDATDEDAFAALEGSGLRVLVRSTPRETHADALCVPPWNLLAFLALWNAL